MLTTLARRLAEQREFDDLQLALAGGPPPQATSKKTSDETSLIFSGKETANE